MSEDDFLTLFDQLPEDMQDIIIRKMDEMIALHAEAV